jgi:hypothetical protein
MKVKVCLQFKSLSELLDMFEVENTISITSTGHKIDIQPEVCMDEEFNGCIGKLKFGCNSYINEDFTLTKVSPNEYNGFTLMGEAIINCPSSESFMKELIKGDNTNIKDIKIIDEKG